jgi:hypothetical protein
VRRAEGDIVEVFAVGAVSAPLLFPLLEAESDCFTNALGFSTSYLDPLDVERTSILMAQGVFQVTGLGKTYDKRPPVRR